MFTQVEEKTFPKLVIFTPFEPPCCKAAAIQITKHPLEQRNSHRVDKLNELYYSQIFSEYVNIQVHLLPWR